MVFIGRRFSFSLIISLMIFLVFAPYSSFIYVQSNQTNFTVSANSNSTWVEIIPAVSPVGRFHHMIGYDTSNNISILVGGSNGPGLNDTWKFNSETGEWTELSPNPTPVLSRSAIAYDQVNQRIVTFGGLREDSEGSEYLSNETWVYYYQNSSWNQIYPINSPSARYFHDMVYDSYNQKLITFGGRALKSGGGLEYSSQLWIYDIASNNWSQIFTDVEPPRRYFHSMVFDSTRNQVFLFGCENPEAEQKFLLDTWIYSLHNNSWKELPTIISPPGRSNFDMTYDKTNDVVVLFGGYDSYQGKNYDDTWIYSFEKNTWAELEFDNKPVQRGIDRGLVYDSNSNKTILFGGINQSGYLDDTWLLQIKDIQIILTENTNKTNMNLTIGIFVLLIFYYLAKRKKREEIS